MGRETTQRTASVFARWTPLFWCHAPWLAIAAWWVKVGGAPTRGDEWATLIIAFVCPLILLWTLLCLIGWPVAAAVWQAKGAGQPSLTDSGDRSRRGLCLVLLVMSIATLLVEFGVAVASLLVDERWMGIAAVEPIPHALTVHGLVFLAAVVWCALALFLPKPPGLSGRWFAGAMQITPVFWLLFLADPVILAGLERMPAAAIYGEGVLAVLTAGLVFGHDDESTRRRGRIGIACMLLLPITLWAIDKAGPGGGARTEWRPGVRVVLPPGFGAIRNAYWAEGNRWLALHVGNDPSTCRTGEVWIVDRKTQTVRHRITAPGALATRVVADPPRVVGYSLRGGPLKHEGIFWSHDLSTGERREWTVAEPRLWPDSFLSPDGKIIAWLERRSEREVVLRRLDVDAWNVLDPVPVPLETDWFEGRVRDWPEWAPDGTLVVTAEYAPVAGAPRGAPVKATQWRLGSDGQGSVYVSSIEALRWIPLVDPRKVVAVLPAVPEAATSARDGKLPQAVVDIATGAVFALPDGFCDVSSGIVCRTPSWLYGDEVDADGKAWVAAYDWNTGERVFRVRKSRAGWRIFAVSDDGRWGLLREGGWEGSFARALDLETGGEYRYPRAADRRPGFFVPLPPGANDGSAPGAAWIPEAPLFEVSLPENGG